MLATAPKQPKHSAAQHPHERKRAQPLYIPSLEAGKKNKMMNKKKKKKKKKRQKKGERDRERER